MPVQKINAINMHYQLHGQGEPLIFVAGFCMDHTGWLHLIAKLEKHYQVLIFDNRGCGQSDAPHAPYTISQMADDLAGLCEHLKIESAHVVGTSMGGFIVQQFTHRYPDKVKSLTITNSTVTFNTPYRYYAEAQLEFFRAQAPNHAIYKAAFSWYFAHKFLSKDNQLEQLIELMEKSAHPMTLPGYEGQLAALVGFDSQSWVHEIQVPTLVIGGDQDIIFNATSTKKLAKLLPNATYQEFKDCGHVAFTEHPEAFLQQLLSFLKTCDSRSIQL